MTCRPRPTGLRVYAKTFVSLEQVVNLQSGRTCLAIIMTAGPGAIAAPCSKSSAYCRHRITVLMKHSWNEHEIGEYRSNLVISSFWLNKVNVLNPGKTAAGQKTWSMSQGGAKFAAYLKRATPRPMCLFSSTLGHFVR